MPWRKRFGCASKSLLIGPGDSPRALVLQVPDPDPNVIHFKVENDKIIFIRAAVGALPFACSGKARNVRFSIGGVARCSAVSLDRGTVGGSRVTNGPCGRQSPSLLRSLWYCCN